MLLSPFSTSVLANARRHLTPSLLRRCTSTQLDRWQRRCDRLTQLQRRIRFARPKVFNVDDQAYELPLPAVKPVRSPSQEELGYLAGFFDGDGCVAMKSTGQMSLQVGQNIDSSAVLLHFRSLLGGSIHRQSASTGSSKAMLQWRVCGSKMSHAAAILSRVPSMKQAQLLIASKGTVAGTERAQVQYELKVLKQKQWVLDNCAGSLWAYFAGFFDAEGAIIVCPTQVSLRLEVSQVSACVLSHLLLFLHLNNFQSWSLRDRGPISILACSSLQDCKQTLDLLLKNGLLVKRKQAELALSLTAENHLEIRDAISSLKGLQARYQRLDSQGVARAREINTLRDKLRSMSGPDHAELLSQLEQLCAEHKLQKLISRCNLLRKDIRQCLRLGGEVFSS